VQYLDPPVLSYPSASRRLGEAGRVMVRVYIDEGGLPRTVQVHASSGFARLDGAAVAAVQKARFRPYVENGRPTAGWAFIPLAFDLEN
jgi:protein TonB